MDFAYSPHRETGGALHLLSPTHAHFHDGLASINKLRRSLSRSPSKPSRFQLYTAKSFSGSPGSPRSPSGLSRAYTVGAADVGSTQPTSPLAGAQPSSSKKGKFILRRSTNNRSISGVKTSPKRPTRRVLSDSTNLVNLKAGASTGFNTEGESLESAAGGFYDMPESAKKPPVPRFDDSPLKIDFSRSRGDSNGIRHSMMPPRSSPLKRSDDFMNLDQASLGSPVAKRRSLHGSGSFGVDFNIFEQPPPTSIPDKDGSSDSDKETPDYGFSVPFSTPAKRTSPLRKSLSLRKSTLQQRHGSTSAVKPRFMVDQSTEFTFSGPTPQKARNRMSLDSALMMNPPDVTSPFVRRDQEDSLRSSTVTDPVGRRPAHPAPLQQPHPLSQILTPSSSTSSMVEDGPQQHSPSPKQPTKPKEFARPTVSFSKSLPIGATRPMAFRTLGKEFEMEVPQDGSFATPDYKSARPLPAAFMSTGLISKRNRDINGPTAGFYANHVMPDTPSKGRAFPIGSATPAPAAISKVSRARPEFGTPSTPFSPMPTKTAGEAFGKGVSIFGTRLGQNGSTRRASFASIDGEENSHSPSGNHDSQSSADEAPPTPTKATGARPHSKGKGNSLRSSLFGRRTSMGPDTFAPPPKDSDDDREVRAPSCKYISPDSSPDEAMDDGTEPASGFGCRGLAESPTERAAAFASERSLLARRSQRNITLTALNRSGLRSPFLQVPPLNRTKRARAASPIANRMDARPPSPRTPSETFQPPDPSGLSISAKDSNRQSLGFGSSTNSNPPFFPATPTNHRESLHFFPGQSTNVPLTTFNNDVDTSITSRFNVVNVFGSGEFSQVYRVEKPVDESFTPQPFGRVAARVWAVKKTKKPFIGVRDREQKLREVEILRALRGHDHIIEFTDSWESKGHLYIQTEFCENGNLKDFLVKTGFKGRLDDFRIWKIMLELAQGIKHIHDCGFIHLDLKPANILIDFSGALKIADFGLASYWPAPRDIDGEGDREYIAPEVLSGRFDKPADVFALGIIMLEIAGNILLPDNGASWQRLRAGDLRDIPSLTFSSEHSLVRDESGEPVDSESQMDGSFEDLNGGPFRQHGIPKPEPPRVEELVQPPNFMVDPHDAQSLDRMVQWLISPSPEMRPPVDQILVSGGIQWVERRRRAGATVFEGNWGPADDVLQPFGHQGDVDVMDLS